ncbi:MAG: hypothetical protein ABW123_24710 [Cystobacter sp.]
MSTTSSSPLPPSSGYTPPLELLQAAEALLRGALPEELTAAAFAYASYGQPTGGRSAITGSELPAFAVCNPLVRAGWLSVVRSFTQWGAPLLRPSSEPIRVDVSALQPALEQLQEMVDALTAVDDEGAVQVDPFVLGIHEIAAATRNLAEADHLTAAKCPDVEELIHTVSAGLLARVKALAQPQS